MTIGVLQGVLEAIGEETNEVGGLLITRLTEGHAFGRNDGILAVGTPTLLTSPVAIFKTTDVGRTIDILDISIPLGSPGGPFSAATGNEGTYIIASVSSTMVVVLDDINGSPASFVTQADVRWRFSNLRVETTLDYPVLDKVPELWVGDEPDPVIYADIITSVGAHEFRGLGEQEFRIDGVISSAAPLSLKTTSDFFTSLHIGKPVWVLPIDPPNGNEGPRIITAVVDPREATITGAGFVADEINAKFRVKTLAEKGYLTKLQDEDSEVIDGSKSFSAIDKLRRALLSDFATEEELDRIGRNYAVIRPKGLGDEQFRCLVQTLSYLPKGTVYAIELVLECLFPGGGYEIIEDLVNFPNNVFIILPDVQSGNSTNFEGKTFLAPTSKVSGVPSKLDPLFIGKKGYEKILSTGTTTLVPFHSPTTPVSVELQDTTQLLDMTVLPSADTPAWTFNAESAGAEGTYFTLVAGSTELEHDHPAGTDSGRYEISVVTLDSEFVALEAKFRTDTVTTVGGIPWKLIIRDGLNEYALIWTDQANLGQADETVHVGPTTGLTLTDGNWHLLRLERKENIIRGYVDGVEILSEPASTFTTSASTNLNFGYTDNANANEWTVRWDDVYYYTKSTRNYLNITRTDGVFSAASKTFTSAAGLFLAGDVGKHIRTYGTSNVNNGVWEIETFNGAGSIDIIGITRGPLAVTADVETTGTTASVAGKNGDLQDSTARKGGKNGALITLDEDWFRPEDGPPTPEPLPDPYILSPGGGGKFIKISNSAGAVNDGSYEILEIVDSRTAVVDYVGGFTPEVGLDWEFDEAKHVVETTVKWELIDANTLAAGTITLRDALPLASTPARIWYTTVLSAQLAKNEFIVNEGSGGAEPNIFYFFYLFDVDSATRGILDEITAAGVIPEFVRKLA